MDKYGQMSKWNRTMTVLSIGIVVGGSLIPWIIGDTNIEWFTIAIVIYSLILVLTMIAYWHIPLDISVSSTLLRVNFLLRKKVFPISDIKSATVFCAAKDFVCKAGIRGYFGWWGKYYDKSFGILYVYASNIRQLILVEMKDGKKYVISCSDAQTMARCINNRIGSSF